MFTIFQYRKENVSTTSNIKPQKRNKRQPNQNKKKRIFECPQCDALFEHNTQLKNHAKEHQVVTR